MTDYESETEYLPAEGPAAPAVPVASQLVLVGAILLLIFGVGYAPTFLARLAAAPTEEPAPAPARATSTASDRPADSSFDDLALAAQAVFVWDVETQRVLYQKNADAQLPLASLTKLMTVLVAHELLTDKALVPITISALRQDGSSGFRDGDTFDLRTLTDLTLLASSNDGAFAIAAAAGAALTETEPVVTFVEAMNVRANELQLAQTYFRNPTGLDISQSEAGAYGSARDVAFLMEYILQHHPDLLELTTHASESFYNEAGAYYDTENTNEAVNQITGLIGSKTGYTDLAGGNLAVAFDAGLDHPVIVVVLGSTLYGRFDDTVRLAAAARLAVSQ